MASPYIYSTALSLIFVAIAASMLILRRKTLSDMSGMMAGMGFGMLTGLITATMYLIPTGDFLWGTIYGSIVGSVAGIALGWMGGPMGVLEGIMAGPMGGMMGAMLGQMTRPFDLTVFMIFFFILQAITISCILYCLAHKKKKESCCWEDHIPAVPTEQIIALIAVFVVAAAIVVMISDFSITKELPAASSALVDSSSIKLPPALAQATQTIEEETAIEGNVQKIAIRISGLRYSPDLIIAKKGMPLVVNLEASDDATCTRDIVFPTINKRFLVAQGGKESFTIDKVDQDIPFHCSMDMMRGKIVVK